MSSRRKRRKISNNSEDDSTDDEFKEELIVLFDGRMWKLAWQNYLRINYQSRVRHSAREIEVLKSRRENVEGLEGIETANYVQKFSKMTPKERIEEINGFGEVHKIDFLKNLLNRLKLSILRHLLKGNFESDTKNRSKLHTIQEVANRFFNITTDLEKRVAEKENISSSSTFLEDYRIMTICDTQVPIEIILLIISFLKYDHEMLFTIGPVCKTIYVCILSSWKSVNITKDNIYQHSLLVLRNISSITFSVFHPKKMFRNEEMQHILKNINPRKLSKISLRMTLEGYVKTLRLLCKGKKNMPYLEHLKHVAFLPIGTDGRPWDDSPSLFRRAGLDLVYKKASTTWKSLRWTNVSPRLLSIHNPLNFLVLETQPSLSTLSVNLMIPYDILRSQHGHLFSSQPFPSILSQENITKLSSELTELCITFHAQDDERKTTEIPEILNSFFSSSHHRLKKLRLTSLMGRRKLWFSSKDKLDFFRFLMPPKSSLEQIQLIHGVEGKTPFPWSFTLSSPMSTTLTKLVVRRKFGGCAVGLEDFLAIEKRLGSSLKYLEVDVSVPLKGYKVQLSMNSMKSLSRLLQSVDTVQTNFFYDLTDQKAFYNFCEIQMIISSSLIRKKLKIDVEGVSKSPPQGEDAMKILSRELKFLHLFLTNFPSLISKSIGEIFFMDGSNGMVGELDDYGGVDTNMVFETFKESMKEILPVKDEDVFYVSGDTKNCKKKCIRVSTVE